MRWLFILPFVVSSSLITLEIANAHGTFIEYKRTNSIEIESRYDTGEPLANAEVTIYTPNNPSTPWQTGVTDENGKFVFTPDINMTGYWEVKVRQAGHGGLVSIPVETTAKMAETNPTPTASTLTAGQRGLMIGSIIWGCIGTALFFTKSQPAAVEASSPSQS